MSPERSGVVDRVGDHNFTTHHTKADAITPRTSHGSTNRSVEVASACSLDERSAGPALAGLRPGWKQLLDKLERKQVRVAPGPETGARNITPRRRPSSVRDGRPPPEPSTSPSSMRPVASSRLTSADSAFRPTPTASTSWARERAAGERLRATRIPACVVLQHVAQP